MKTKLILGMLLMMCNIVAGQKNQIAIGAHLIPSYYQNSNPDVLDYYFYEGKKAKEFVSLKNLNVDFMIHKHIGLQVGFQTHHITLENTNYIIEYEMAGSELMRIKDEDYSVKITSRRYEIPISLILMKSLNSKIDLSLLLGGSPMLRSKTIKYELNNKANGEIEFTESELTKVRTMSKFSPHIQFRMQYKVLEKWKINSLVLLKSKEMSSFEKLYFGVGIGISYQLN